jgi:hypothetical protein
MKSAKLFVAAVLTLVLFFSLELRAQSNFTDNPLTPYPPGCATTPSRQTLMYGSNVHKFFEGEWRLQRSRANSSMPVNVALYRVACAEPDRSVIWVEFSISQLNYYPGYELNLPSMAVLGRGQDEFGKEKDIVWRLDLVPEPGSWQVESNRDMTQPVLGDYADGFDDASRNHWLYILDVPSPRVGKPEQEWVTDTAYYFSADQYNGEFTLFVDDPWDFVYGESGLVKVPSTASLFPPNPETPLNGRLSGLWVAPEASDQGVVINVSTAPGMTASKEDIDYGQQLFVFLSWYTYDAGGNMLWLTGAAPFAAGESQVTVPLFLVEGGQFMGSKSASRTNAGSVTITGNNCNDLGFDFDLAAIGLGSGSTHLKRIFSMELAGYACRDMLARWEDLQ